MMHRIRVSQRTRILGALLMASIVAGCSGDPAITPPPDSDPTTLYWQLTLNVHAVTLSTVSPYDTVRILATPRTISGSPIADLPAPTYTSLDLDRAQVDSSGLVHVIGSGDQVQVVASLEVNNILHADTLVLNVTNEAAPPPIASLTIHPNAGDSAKVAVRSTVTLRPRAADASGTPIPDVAVYFTTSDPTVATIDRSNGFLVPVRSGQVTVYVTTTTYGVTKSDTLPYTIGHPILMQIEIVPQQLASGQIVSAFSPAYVELGPGARVLFLNTGAPATDVTFDDPTNVAQDDLYCSLIPIFCGAGNIAPWDPDPNAAKGVWVPRVRLFPVPGTYAFHSTIFGTSGTIVVVDEHTP
jgi:plastocyanin